MEVPSAEIAKSWRRIIKELQNILLCPSISPVFRLVANPKISKSKKFLFLIKMSLAFSLIKYFW